MGALSGPKVGGTMIIRQSAELPWWGWLLVAGATFSPLLFYAVRARWRWAEHRIDAATSRAADARSAAPSAMVAPGHR